MPDKIGTGNPYGVGGKGGPSQPRTPAPRRDPAGSTGAFDPVKATSAPNTVPRAKLARHGDFIENSLDPVGSTHVHDHIVHGATPPDGAMGVRHASSEYPKRKGFEDFDTGGGVNYEPKGSVGHKV